MWWLIFGCSPPPPLSHDAYVWQRQWTPAVQEAVTGPGASFDRLAVLGTEIGAETARIGFDAESLRGRPVVLVLRVGAGASPILVADEAAALVDRGRAAGLDVVELQVDYDAASAELADYERWIRVVAARVDPLPLTITALPDWLDRPELPALLAATDGWVLQVHAFPVPRDEAHVGPILDPRAEAQIRTAAGLGRPFRVALPTYGYVAAFAPDGTYVGAAAERQPTWAPGVRTVSVEADPAEVAALVRALDADRPRGLEGLTWFRLPTAVDQAGWAWPTLEAVRAGRTPTPALEVVAEADGTGLVEVSVRNEGDAAAPLPDLAVRTPVPAEAADGYGRWAAVEGGFRPRVEGTIGPGERAAVGWMRFREPIEVQVVVR